MLCMAAEHVFNWSISCRYSDSLTSIPLYAGPNLELTEPLTDRKTNFDTVDTLNK